jgi:hypothetical protein
MCARFGEHSEFAAREFFFGEIIHRYVLCFGDGTAPTYGSRFEMLVSTWA